MLAAGSATKVFIGNQDSAIGKPLIGKRMDLALGGKPLDIVLKGVFTNAIKK